MGSRPKVADVGTGTGAFLIHLAAEYPAATLRGFDISSELFPAPEKLPNNVELLVMDVKNPPPLSEQSCYDIVHVRLLTAAMKPGDWEVAVRNVCQLLRPGGALQWEEANFLHAHHLRGRLGCSVSAARFMGTIFRESLQERLSSGWSTLGPIIQAAGLIDLEEDIVSSDRIADTRKSLTLNGMRAIFAWARHKMDHNAPGSLSMDQMQTLESQAERDIESGCYVRFDIHIFLGTKPM